MSYKSVHELTPGMILNESIYDQNKVLLLPEGTVFTSEGIALIKKLGFYEVKVRQPTDEPWPMGHPSLSDAQIMQFQSTYAEVKKDFADMIKYISAGNQVKMDEAYSVINRLTGQIGSMHKVFAYLNQVQHLDDHTIGHSLNVAVICGIISFWIGLDETMKQDVMVAGLLHDIGKSLVSQSILNKKSDSLTEEEWAQFKKHTVYGYQMLKRADMPSIVQQGALLHHEREDGQGYPLKLRHIPLAVKIIALADIYDIMTTDRKNRKKSCAFQVMKELKYNYFGVLDTKLLMTFLSRIGECYIGERVHLSNGLVGEVLYVCPREPTKPLVKTEQGLINLQESPEVEIEYIL